MGNYSREWCIALDIDRSYAVSLTIAADNQTLLPVVRLPSPDHLLEHVEAALVDVRRGDSLTGVVRKPGAQARIYSASSREVILSWIASVMLEVT
jgi:hypothetical protein